MEASQWMTMSKTLDTINLLFKLTCS